jgi:hypothetical protein
VHVSKLTIVIESNIVNLLLFLTNFRRIDSNLRYNESHLNFTQSMLSAFDWHFDFSTSIPNELKESQIENSSSTTLSINRNALINRVQELFKEIKNNTNSINSLTDKLNSLEQPILKRLEWTAGANPNLLDTLKGFESIRNRRNELNKAILNFFVILMFAFN